MSHQYREHPDVPRQMGGNELSTEEYEDVENRKAEAIALDVPEEFAGRYAAIYVYTKAIGEFGNKYI